MQDQIRNDRRAIHAARNEPYGVGGWLLVILLRTGLSALFVFAAMLNESGGVAIGLGLWFAFTIAVIVAGADHRRIFPTMILWHSGLDALSGLFLLTVSTDSFTTGQGLGAILFSGAVAAYILKSERVEQTYRAVE